MNFASESYQPFVKIIPLTRSDFLSNVGGFLGLLVGISILSIFEILYHIAAIKLKNKQQVHPVGQRSTLTAWAVEEHPLFQLMKYSTNYLKASDMLGMGYMQNQTIGRAGRFFWALLVILSLTICTILVIDLNHHAEKSPIITRIDSKMQTLDEVSKKFSIYGESRSLNILADSVSSSFDWTESRLRQIHR